jgi:hypothetical protein
VTSTIKAASRIHLVRFSIRILSLVVALLFLFQPSWGQSDGTIVNQTVGPPPIAYSSLYFYDASNNLQYLCSARSKQTRAATLTVTGVTSANPAEFTVTAHGLQSGNQITVAGATGDWTEINGTHIVTVTAANTFTIAVDTTGNAGTTFGATTTMASQSSQPQWAIQKFTYDVGNKLTISQWAAGTTGLTQVCDNRASLSYF